MGNKKQKQKVVLPPMLPPDVPEDDIEFSDEDLDFVKSNHDYAGFVSNLDTQSLTRWAASGYFFEYAVFNIPHCNASISRNCRVIEFELFSKNLTMKLI